MIFKIPEGSEACCASERMKGRLWLLHECEENSTGVSSGTLSRVWLKKMAQACSVLFQNAHWGPMMEALVQHSTSYLQSSPVRGWVSPQRPLLDAFQFRLNNGLDKDTSFHLTGRAHFDNGCLIDCVYLTFQKDLLIVTTQQR